MQRLSISSRSLVYRGKSLAALRERVERQRSINTNILGGSESNSLEGLNLERGESQTSKRSVDKLDTQVSTLHQDVAALSVEVNGFVFPPNFPSLKYLFVPFAGS